MTCLRSRLGLITALWLCCQIGMLGLVPVVTSIAATDSHQSECSCGHGPSAMCPMHHKPSGESSTCAIRAASPSETAVLTTLVSIAGLVPEPSAFDRPAAVAGHVAEGDVPFASRRPVPPDPPPPRA